MTMAMFNKKYIRGCDDYPEASYLSKGKNYNGKVHLDVILYVGLWFMSKWDKRKDDIVVLACHIL